jgi:ATP-dependent protease ClpP protease subunit
MECRISIIGEVKTGAFLRFKNSFDKRATSLIVEIDSGGGLVSEGFMIGEFIRMLNIPTRSEIIGDCMSIATYIARTCQYCVWIENERTDRSYLIHSPYISEIDCNEYRCDAETLLDLGYKLSDMESIIRSLYLHRTKASLEEINELMRAEKKMTAQEANELYFVDEIIEKPKPQNIFMNLFEKVASLFVTKGVSKEVIDNVKAEFDAVALEIELDNGAMIYVETEDGEIEGKRAYMVATGEPAPDGEHKLIDGRTITVQNGIIVSVSEAENMQQEEEKTTNETAMTEEKMAEAIQDAVNKALEKLAPKQSNTPPPAKAYNTHRKPAVSAHRLDAYAIAFAQAKKLKVANHLAEQARNQAIVPDFDTQWTGEWAKEILIQPAVNVPDITRLFRIITDVRGKLNLPIAGYLNRIVKRYGGCGVPVAGEGTNITNRVLETCRLEVFQDFCVDDFEDTIFILLQNSGLNKNDISGTVIEGLIVQLIQEAMMRDLFIQFSFAKSALTGDEFYGVCDGLWEKLIENSSTAAGASVKRLSDITALNQTANSRAYDYLVDVYTQAPAALRQVPANRKAFFVTQNIYDNYLAFLENPASGIDPAWVMLQEGTNEQTLSFRGIRVIPILAWDEDLALADNPFNRVFNTAILYTTPDNHYVGVGADQRGVRFWYDKNTRTNKFEAFPELGYEYMADYLQCFKIGEVA